MTARGEGATGQRFDRYVGIPWVDRGRAIEGCDCWGLLRLVHLEMRATELPSYRDDYATAVDRRAVAALIRGELEPWDEIAAGSEQAFDGVLMREIDTAGHVGVVTRPGWLLHVARGRTSTIEPYRHGPLAHRVLGFYRLRNHE